MPLKSEHTSSIDEQLKQERDRLSLLLEVNNAVVSTLDLRDLLKAVSTSLRRLLSHEYACLSLYDPDTQLVQIHALDFLGSKGVLHEGLTIPIADTPASRWLTSRQPVFLNRKDVEEFQSEFGQRIRAEGHKSVCCLPLIAHGRPLGNLVFASLREDTFPEKDAKLLQHVANQIALAVENALAFGRVVDLANRLKNEKLYLQDEIRSALDFEEIVGESPALKSVLQQARTVAPTESTVLIQGEAEDFKGKEAKILRELRDRRGKLTAIFLEDPNGVEIEVRNPR
jgi:formate hydrogenlyase transcriptional activator